MLLSSVGLAFLCLLIAFTEAHHFPMLIRESRKHIYLQCTNVQSYSKPLVVLVLPIGLIVCVVYAAKCVWICVCVCVCVWCMFAILAFGRLRQKNWYKFKASLGYIVNFSSTLSEDRDLLQKPVKAGVSGRQLRAFYISSINCNVLIKD